MKEEQFIKTNSNSWKELEDIILLINKKSMKSLSSKEIKKFLSLFTRCSHHLSYAKTYYPQSDIVKYLNSLIGKCHSHVYAVKKLSPSKLINYICYSFPKLLKENNLFILTSFVFFIFGVIISLLLVFHDVNNATMFLPKPLIEGVKLKNSGTGQWNAPLMSSYIMVNNITVSLKAFALGITFGLGTMYVLFFNGALLGALTALIYTYGSPLTYWSLILPHGVIELTAIFISGAAGLIIAKSMVIPNEYSRKHSIINGAKKAISLILGVIFMLIIAGIIEGFFTPLDIKTSSKLIFAGITAILLGAYFSIPYLVKDSSSY